MLPISSSVINMYFVLDLVSRPHRVLSSLLKVFEMMNWNQILYSPRLLVWSLVEWSRSRVVFKFKFCGLMLTIDFEEIDQESYKTCK